MYIHPLANASSKVIFGVDISKTVAIIEFLRIVNSTGTGTDTLHPNYLKLLLKNMLSAKHRYNLQLVRTGKRTS